MVMVLLWFLLLLCAVAMISPYRTRTKYFNTCCPSRPRSVAISKVVKPTFTNLVNIITINHHYQHHEHHYQHHCHYHHKPWSYFPFLYLPSPQLAQRTKESSASVPTNYIQWRAEAKGCDPWLGMCGPASCCLPASCCFAAGCCLATLQSTK